MTFEGAMTALVTPFRDGAVDKQALAGLIEDQIAAGIDGLVAVGTTGESATLPPGEHIDVVKHVVDVVNKRVPVIGGAGANATFEAIELSEACREAGVDGLLHVTPYYNKPTQDGLYRHFETVAKAGRLPVILYNVPGRTSCDLLPETVERLTAVDYVVAIKEATGSMTRATEIVQRCGDRITVLSGDDFTSFPLYAVGARGVISVVSNVAPAWMADMWDAVSDGRWDDARALHYKLQPLTKLLFAEANPIPVKAALTIMGKIGPEIRAPMYEASPGLQDKLRERLEAEGLV